MPSFTADPPIVVAFIVFLNELAAVSQFVIAVGVHAMELASSF